MTRIPALSSALLFAGSDAQNFKSISYMASDITDGSFGAWGGASPATADSLVFSAQSLISTADTSQDLATFDTHDQSHSVSGTVFGGNHKVGGEGQANFPDLPQAALDNAIDHLPTFLGGNHQVGGEGQANFPDLATLDTHDQSHSVSGSNAPVFGQLDDHHHIDVPEHHYFDSHWLV